MPRVYFFLGLSVLCVLGCGSGDGRVEISGSVTFKKQPLEQGMIQFLPEQPDKASMLMLPIRAGKYQIDREKGLLPGTYRILLSSPAGGPKVAPADVAPGDSTAYVHKELLPAEYNTESKKKVTVEAGKANVFDFDIP